MHPLTVSPLFLGGQFAKPITRAGNTAMMKYFPAKARRGIVGDDVDWLNHFSAETIALKTQAGKIYF